MPFQPDPAILRLTEDRWSFVVIYKHIALLLDALRQTLKGNNSRGTKNVKLKEEEEKEAEGGIRNQKYIVKRGRKEFISFDNSTSLFIDNIIDLLPHAVATK